MLGQRKDERKKLEGPNVKEKEKKNVSAKLDQAH